MWCPPHMSRIPRVSHQMVMVGHWGRVVAHSNLQIALRPAAASVGFFSGQVHCIFFCQGKSSSNAGHVCPLSRSTVGRHAPNMR